MTKKELRSKIEAKLAELEKINSAFMIGEVDEDEDWYENLSEWEGRVSYGTLSNYIIFIKEKEDGFYVSLVCETEPLMITNDGLFGRGIKPSDLDYDFSTSIFDVATDFSYNNAKPIWEEKV